MKRLACLVWIVCLLLCACKQPISNTPNSGIPVPVDSGAFVPVDSVPVDSGGSVPIDSNTIILKAISSGAWRGSIHRGYDMYQGEFGRNYLFQFCSNETYRYQRKNYMQGMNLVQSFDPTYDYKVGHFSITKDTLSIEGISQQDIMTGGVTLLSADTFKFAISLVNSIPYKMMNLTGVSNSFFDTTYQLYRIPLDTSTQNQGPIITGLIDTTILIRDSVCFRVRASDFSGVVQKYYWNFGDNSVNQHETTSTGAVFHLFPSVPMVCVIGVTVKSTFGYSTTQQARVNVIRGLPIAMPGEDTTISIDDRLMLDGTQSHDMYKEIVKYEWDPGNTGSFSVCPDGKMEVSPSFAAPDTLGNDFPCVLRVTDANGAETTATRQVHIGLCTKIGDNCPLLPREESAHVVFQEKLWVIGGSDLMNSFSDVWYSADGISWLLATASPGFSKRTQLAAVAYDNKIWVIGGWDGVARNDVWNTSDGVNWTKVADTADFSPRRRHQMVTFNNKMWLIGGDAPYTANPDDVWWSADGISWTKVLGSGLPALEYHQTIVFGGKIYIVGGRGAGNKVWCSSDGSNWQLVTGSAPFAGRMNFDVSECKNRIWLVGGHDDNTGVNYADVWYSADGAQWSRALRYGPFASRISPMVSGFNGHLIVLGGQHGMYATKDVWAIR